MLLNCGVGEDLRVSCTAAAAAESLQSCLTLCDPIDGSPPGSPVPGILQARTLEWVAISISNAWKWKVKVKSLSRVQPSATPWTAAYEAPPSMGFSRQEYWSGVPLPSPSCTARRSNQSILKEISPEYSLEGLMLKLKFQFFGHLMRRNDSLEKILMLGKIEGRRTGDDRGWDRWMALLSRWTWVWASSGSWWCTGKPGMLHPQGCKKSDTTERRNWTESKSNKNSHWARKKYRSTSENFNKKLENIKIMKAEEYNNWNENCTRRN